MIHTYMIYTLAFQLPSSEVTGPSILGDLKDFFLSAFYLLLIFHLLSTLLLLLLKWLCPCRAQPEQRPPVLKRPPFLPASDSYLPPLRPHPNEHRPQRKRTPECCIFSNFCS